MNTLVQQTQFFWATLMSPLRTKHVSVDVTFYFNNADFTYIYEILHTGWVEMLAITHWLLEHFQQSQTLASLFWALLYGNSNFFATHIAEIRLRFAIWAFSSLRIQICSLKAGFKTRKISFLPLINTIPTPDDTLKVLCAKYFVLTLMYLLRQYIY